MDIKENIEKDYIQAQIKDQENREKSIKDGEELDKKIYKRMNANEIGVSLGTDNHIGIIMFITATIFTALALYFIFGVVPDRLEG